MLIYERENLQKDGGLIQNFKIRVRTELKTMQIFFSSTCI